VAVAVIPEGNDPADFVASDGADAVRALVDGAQPLLRFVIDRRLEAHDLATPEGRSAGLAAAVRVLAGMKGSILAEDYASYLAGRLMIDYETVMSALRTATPESGNVRTVEAEPVAATSRTRRRPPVDAQGRAEEELLRQITQAPELREQARELLKSPGVFTDPVNREIADAIIGAQGATGTALYDSVRAVGPELADELSAWLVDAADREGLAVGFAENASRLKDFALRRQILTMQAEMRSMDRVKDPVAYDDVFRRIAALQREQQALRVQAAGTSDDTKAEDRL
jgi:DNA primase